MRRFDSLFGGVNQSDQSETLLRIGEKSGGYSRGSKIRSSTPSIVRLVLPFILFLMPFFKCTQSFS